jgi:glycosyltransferase involved in cell wall biosynthesis
LAPLKVSFVIPAHNEEKLIARTLESIHAAGDEALGRGEYEIVVADDASTDRTGEIARTFEHRGTRVVRAENRQISKTRNTGAKASVGDVLVFVDADTSIDPEIVRAAVAVIEKGGIGGGAGVRLDGKVPFWATVMLELTVLLFRVAGYTGGCFLFCTRQALEKAGGWDETLFAGEEIELCRALKRHGKFVVLRHRVMTSGRKLRTHSAREIVGFFIKAALMGRRAVRSRDGLELWYGPRREEKGGV